MLSNELTLVGNVTRDPELRYTTGGRAVASFGVACNRRFMVNNEWQEEVSFFDVTAWADLGENVAQSISKGNRVLVAGRMDQRKYTDREGNERTAWQVTAESVGPCLRFATAIVERTERTAPSEQRQAPARSGGNDPIYGDENPF